jgi:spermidine synthase
MNRLFHLLTVIITGATVLALEVLGTRVIGTYYGNSLYVWAALLCTTLVCLALGYAVGGRLADRLPSPRTMYVIVLLSGLAIWLVPRLTGVLAPLGERLGLAWGAMASAFAIFFLPLTLLAMMSPYVIRLRAPKVEGVGATSGLVYALSTVGSVAGVLLVGFVMIPTLGTTRSLSACSGAMIALGAVGLAFSWRAGGWAIILLVLPLAFRPAHVPLPGEIYHAESPYGELRVIDNLRDRHRMLMVNGVMQTGLPLDMDLLGRAAALKTDSYYLELLPYYFPDLAAGRQGILIGLAGGMLPRVMEMYDVDLTAVEIDVKVAELAKAYFGYRGEIRLSSGRRLDLDVSRFPNRQSLAMHQHLDQATPEHRAEHESPGPYHGRALIQDGRQYLASHPVRTDFIVVDAYNSDSIPFHLITREFFRLVRSRLVDDGVLAINYIGRPAGDFVTDSLFRTLQDVFGKDMIRAYRTLDNDKPVQVIIVFAFMREKPLLPLWRDSSSGPGTDRLSYELARRELAPDPARGIVITDDLNPIDLARCGTAMEWRMQTMLATRSSPTPQQSGLLEP